MGLFIALVGYVFSGFTVSYPECLNHPATWAFTLFFGWLPGIKLVDK